MKNYYIFGMNATMDATGFNTLSLNFYNTDGAMFVLMNKLANSDKLSDSVLLSLRTQLDLYGVGKDDCVMIFSWGSYESKALTDLLLNHQLDFVCNVFVANLQPIALHLGFPTNLDSAYEHLFNGYQTGFHNQLSHPMNLARKIKDIAELSRFSIEQGAKIYPTLLFNAKVS